MADSLLLRLPRNPDAAATWLVVDSRGTPLGSAQSGPLALAAAQLSGRHVCVLVPGTDVLLAEPDIPGRTGAKLHSLVPFALEEHLADNIEDLHFAIGRRAGELGRTPVAVVARRLLDEWLVTLRAAGIEPDAIYADSDLLPQNPGQAVALLEEDAVFVRAPGASVVVLPADALAEALEIAQTGADLAAGGRGLILYTGAAEWQLHAAQVEAVRSRFDGIKIQLLTAGPLALFAQQLPGGTAINLLQGSYAPQSGRAVGLKAWRIAAILFGCLIGLHLIGKVTLLELLKSREHKIDVSMRETFHGAMPLEPLTADMRGRMEQRLAAARGAGGGLLPALQALAQARDAAPGTNVQALSIHSGMVEIKLSAPDAASLDRLSQSLSSSGWQAQLVGGDNTAAGYSGRLQLHMSGT